jgi:hypothetical protein
MKHVYPVHWFWNNDGDQHTYFIVANSVEEAEEIAFECIAANLPCSDGPPLPSSRGREVARVHVRDSWAQPTHTEKTGLIGSGSPILLAKALALYVERHGLS